MFLTKPFGLEYMYKHQKQQLRGAPSYKFSRKQVQNMKMVYLKYKQASYF